MKNQQKVLKLMNDILKGMNHNDSNIHLYVILKRLSEVFLFKTDEDVLLHVTVNVVNFSVDSKLLNKVYSIFPELRENITLV